MTEIDRNDSQNDIVSIQPDAICGPSPLTASAVARLVVDTARRYRVDPQFALAVSTTESDLDRDRNSPKGARGPMQLMPSTAALLGVADICDPAQNIDAGVRLLRSLFQTYHNPLLVAAAYNAGATTVERYGGVPPFPETVHFVSEVINRRFGRSLRGSAARDAGTALSGIAGIAGSAVLSAGNERQWIGGVMQF